MNNFAYISAESDVDRLAQLTPSEFYDIEPDTGAVSAVKVYNKQKPISFDKIPLCPVFHILNEFRASGFRVLDYELQGETLLIEVG